MKDGGPAFPYEQVDRGIYGTEYGRKNIPGMSLRDYFASQCLLGLMPNAVFEGEESAKIVAKNCYFYADAMLMEREKNGR